MRYFELIDDLGQDYYRTDGDVVERWDSLDGVWCITILGLADVLEIGYSEYTYSFTEVTESDVR